MIPTKPVRFEIRPRLIFPCLVLGTVLVGCTEKTDNPVCGCVSPIFTSSFHSFEIPARIHRTDTLIAVANNPGCSRYSHTYSYQTGDTVAFGPNYYRQSCSLAADTSTTFTFDSVKVVMDSGVSTGAHFFRFKIGRKGFADSVATVPVTIL